MHLMFYMVDMVKMVAFKEFCKVLNDESKFTISAKKPRACIDYVLGTNGTFKPFPPEKCYFPSSKVIFRPFGAGAGAATGPIGSSTIS